MAQGSARLDCVSVKMLGIMLDAISDDILTALDDSDVDSDLSDLFAEEDGLINSLFEHELNGLRPIDTFDGPAAILTPWIELQPHDFHD